MLAFDGATSCQNSLVELGGTDTPIQWAHYNGVSWRLGRGSRYLQAPFHRTWCAAGCTGRTPD